MNTNGKQFIINTVEITKPNGKVGQMTVLCYEGNYNHPDIQSGEAKPLEEGKSYLTTIRFDEEHKPQLQMSHLTNANRPTTDDFKELFASAGIPFTSMKVEGLEEEDTAEVRENQAERAEAGAGAPE